MESITWFDWVIIIAYFVAVIYIGKWATSQVKDEQDYLLAGKSLGKIPAAFSTAATDFGGAGLIGAAGLAYSKGLAGGWWDLCAVPAWIILGLTLAAGFRKLALCTVPELLEKRYNSTTRVVTAVLHLLGTGVSVTAQMVIAALAITTLTGIPKEYTLIFATVIFVIYTTAGGLIAVVWTDVMQYLVLMIGIIVALPLAIVKAGGWSHIVATVPASFWDLGAIGWMEPLAWIALCFFSYSTSQFFVQRIFASKDESTARFAYVFTGINYFFYAFIVAVLGICAAVICPGLEDTQMAIPVVIKYALPVGLKGLLLAAILAATMSTSSSMLNACSSIFTIDLYKRFMNKNATEQQTLRVARWATLIIAAFSFLVSFSMEGVIEIVVLANLIYSAGVFFPLVLGMYSKRVNAYGAVSGIVIGGGFAVYSNFMLYGKVGGLFGALHPMFVGSLTSLIILLVVSFLTPKPEPEKVDWVNNLDATVEGLQDKF
jgi:SSS family solute:Na+ symporter